MNVKVYGKISAFNVNGNSVVTMKQSDSQAKLDTVSTIIGKSLTID